MSKRGCFRGCFVEFIMPFVIFALVSILLLHGCMSDHSDDNTLLFEKETSNGYLLTVYQIGPPDGLGLHSPKSYTIQIHIDGTPILEFEILTNDSVAEKHLSVEVSLEVTRKKEFHLSFENSNYYFYFDADFKELKIASCRNLKILDESITVTKYFNLAES